ncbi:calcium-binding protein [Massilia sp. NR 4-1]|uniref:calcium-binding protein n=1 Tax=Massilia sp. NR 4-1 TaxID=1678028 RepID=UPI000AC7356C|nr:calcium-binding protein [Massilia sp. NR 4-1]
MRTITINIAGRGTLLANGEKSSVGHMWFELNDGAGGPIESYGFAPDASHHGDPFAPGQVYRDDSKNYKGRDYFRTIDITEAQYNEIKKFAENPETAGFTRYYNGLNNSCIDFTWKALQKGGLNPIGYEGDLWPTHNIDDIKKIGDPFHPPGSTGLTNLGGIGGLGSGLGAALGLGKGGADAAAWGSTPPRRDPLVLDLDGDGIETTSTRDGTVILFDHDADGVKTGTGWIKPDDGWLVLDRNGNSTIDSGRELFGVDTRKANGQLASDGFDALKDFDANKDGKIDALDSVFANLRIWRDLNQDGVSQANELSTLATNSIVSISVNANAVRTDLGNGNVQTASGAFTRSNGSTGATGEVNGATVNLDLLVNTFYRQFSDHISLTEQAKALPELHGAGWVRDLSEAISLSSDLGNWVQLYTQQTTRQGQIDKLDGFIEKWASTAGVKSLKAQADAFTATGVKLVYNLSGLSVGSTAYDGFVRKLGVVECFMGFTYGGTNGEARFTPLDKSSGSITVNLSTEQIASISLAYDRFKGDIYESLIPETHLKLYTKLLLEDCQGPAKFEVLENAFKQAVSANQQQGIIELIEFISSVGEARLASIGWEAIPFLGAQISSISNLGAFAEELSSWTVRLAASTEHNITGTSRADLLAGTAAADKLYGYDGNDILNGGTGNDTLAGGVGNDTYVFNLGDGFDIINDYDPTSGNSDKLQFGAGINADAVLISRSSNGRDLTFSVNATDKITVVDYFYSSVNRIEKVAFADGTVWDVAAMAERQNGTEGADNLFGLSGYANRINGLGGNDSISGADKDDVFSGGAGNDTLAGGVGNDTYVFNLGDGFDIINDYDPTSGNSDKLQFGAGINADAVLISRGSNGRDLTFSINATDKITVVDYFYSSVSRIEKVAFADGTVWDVAAMAERQNGTEGADNLFGLSGYANRINGLGGNDSITGADKDDVLSGGTGNDTLAGGVGNDTYVFNLGDGFDIINDYDPTSGNSDKLQFGAGINADAVLISRSSNGRDLTFSINATDKITVVDHFYSSVNRIEKVAFADGTVWDVAAMAERQNGTEGADNLFGLSGYANRINGLGGNDSITGADKDDVLSGGTGNDTLAGGVGNDTYVFNLGDGFDIINDYDPTSGNSDKLQFGAGINADAVLISRSSNGRDLTFSINATDKITVVDHFYSSVNRIEKVAFADGTVWDVAAMAERQNGTEGADNLFGLSGYANRINGLGGNDSITGADKDDVLSGGTGNDTLAGGVGNDTYVFNLGDGFDIINDYDPTSGNSDKLQFGAGINADAVLISRSSNGRDLTFSINATDKITVVDHFYSSVNRIEKVAFADGTVWDVAAMAERQNGTEGADNLFGLSGYANRINGLGGNDSITGADKDDVLSGGTGNDTLAGGVGNDTYVFNLGDGFDIINDYDPTSGNSDKLQFGAGINADAVLISRSSNGRDLTFSINATDKITVVDHFYSSVNRIEKVVFADGTVWDVAAMAERQNGTEGADNLFGLSGYANRINGLGGNDSITGADKDDVLDGGNGADNISGDAGNDILIGSYGNDILAGGAGKDIFRFVSSDQGIDSITDFNSGADVIQVLGSNFGLATGVAVSLISGTTTPAPSGTVAQFLYNTTSGALYFDQDGVGTAAAIQIATLTGQKTLTASDIVVVGT